MHYSSTVKFVVTWNPRMEPGIEPWEGKLNVRCLFLWKTFYRDSFSHFLVFGSAHIHTNTHTHTHKKKRVSEFSQWKILIKIRLIFYRLFSKKKIWKTISLSLVAFPINIIFFCNHRKHNFLTPSLSHGKLSPLLSLLFSFYLIIYSLFWIPSLIFFFSMKFLV